MIRPFAPADRAAMLGFANALPEHDLLFLGRDLQHPRVVEAWAEAIGEGYIDSVIAEQDGAIAGTAALVRDPLGWSRHVGEVRVLVGADHRGKGVGRALLAEVLRIAGERGLAKLSARMTPDQTAAIELFESVGFLGEALLKDQVIDRAGGLHDIAVLSLNLAREAKRREVFGERT